MSFYGCSEEEVIQSIGSGGTCLFVNHNTKDSVRITGDSGIGSLEEINVRNGDMLELTFIPDRNYEKYNFAVVYTLMDGTQHSCANDNYTYKFIVSDWGAQTGRISFNAKSTDKNIDITAGGAINVTLLESEPADDNDESVDDNDEPADDDESVDNRASVELTYEFECDSDLVRFVTPEIIYTDEAGEHNIVLNENQWSPITFAYCYYTENGATNYKTFELTEGEIVPEPWQMEYAYSFFKWKQIVKLNKIGVTNHFVVRYHRKSEYAIEQEREYELGRKLYCSNGHSSFVSEEGKLVVNTYNSTSIDIGGQTRRRGSEVQKYIDEICAKNDTVSMKIDNQGNFTLLSKK